MSTETKLNEYLTAIDNKIADISNVENLENLLKIKANLVIALGAGSGVPGSDGITQNQVQQAIQLATNLNQKWTKLQNSTDLTINYTYLQAGTDNERINTITYSSSSLNLSVIEQYSYQSINNTYILSSITRS